MADPGVRDQAAEGQAVARPSRAGAATGHARGLYRRVADPGRPPARRVLPAAPGRQVPGSRSSGETTTTGQCANRRQGRATGPMACGGCPGWGAGRVVPRTSSSACADRSSKARAGGSFVTSPVSRPGGRPRRASSIRGPTRCAPRSARRWPGHDRSAADRRPAQPAQCRHRDRCRVPPAGTAGGTGAMRLQCRRDRPHARQRRAGKVCRARPGLPQPFVPRLPREMSRIEQLSVR
jgi:hypothetical protein